MVNKTKTTRSYDLYINKGFTCNTSRSSDVDRLKRTTYFRFLCRCLHRLQRNEHSDGPATWRGSISVR